MWSLVRNIDQNANTTELQLKLDAIITVMDRYHIIVDVDSRNRLENRERKCKKIKRRTNFLLDRSAYL